MGGCDYAMHLDMNPYHTGFLFIAVDDLTGHKYKSQLLTSAMSIPSRSLHPVRAEGLLLRHGPRPDAPADRGERRRRTPPSPWQPDDGAQPPPRWMPGVWKAQLAAPEGTVRAARRRARALDLARARGRQGRAGRGAAPGARRRRGGPRAPGRGRRASPTSAGPSGSRPTGASSSPCAAARTPACSSSTATGSSRWPWPTPLPALGPHDDLVELPIALWDGKPASVATGPGAALPARGPRRDPDRPVDRRARRRPERGPSGARAREGRLHARASCSIAGPTPTGFLDRAGTSSPPRAGYDESVLYAVGSPLRPSGFRFDASTPVVQSARAR